MGFVAVVSQLLRIFRYFLPLASTNEKSIDHKGSELSVFCLSV